MKIKVDGHKEQITSLFSSGFSQDSISITVGEQITVEQLIEKRIVMRISRLDHVYRHHIRDK